MKQPIIYRVDYVDHSGNDCRAFVRVHATIAEDGSGREVFYAYHPHKLGCGKNAGTPDAAALRLANDHGYATSCKRMPPTLADLHAECSTAYQQALQQARRTTGRGFHRSRRRYVVVTTRNDALVGFGEWEWRNTAKQLREVMAYALDPNVTGIYIDGGVDFAAALRDFEDGAYEPWVAEWSITLYNNDVETFRKEASK